MRNGQFSEYDIDKIYKKLIAPSTPITVKGCDFFKQEDLLTLLQNKIAYVAAADVGKKLWK